MLNIKKHRNNLIYLLVFLEFYKDLKGKQALVLGGLFKEAHKMYLNKEKDEIKY